MIARVVTAATLLLSSGCRDERTIAHSAAHSRVDASRPQRTAEAPDAGVERANAAALSDEQCVALYRSLKDRIGEAGSCERHDDCRLLALACPFGCLAAVNRRAPIDTLEKDMVTFVSGCSYCTMTCLPPDGPPSCVHGNCVLRPESPTKRIRGEDGRGHHPASARP